jgi:hypothetical protein
MTCQRCSTTERVFFSGQAQQNLCESCFELDEFGLTDRTQCQGERSPAPPSRPVPPTSPLTPLATATPEAEVDELLRLHAAGELGFAPEHVELPELPDNATEAMSLVATDFALVCGLRRAAGKEGDVAYGTEWVGARIGVPGRTVHRSLERLAAAGVLVCTGELPRRARRRRGTRLWAPVPIASAQVLPVPARDTTRAVAAR